MIKSICFHHSIDDYLFIENKTSIDTDKLLSRRKNINNKKSNAKPNDVQRFSCVEDFNLPLPSTFSSLFLISCLIHSSRKNSITLIHLKVSLTFQLFVLKYFVVDFLNFSLQWVFFWESDRLLWSSISRF